MLGAPTVTVACPPPGTALCQSRLRAHRQAGGAVGDHLCVDGPVVRPRRPAPTTPRSRAPRRWLTDHMRLCFLTPPRSRRSLPSLAP